VVVGGATLETRVGGAEVVGRGVAELQEMYIEFGGKAMYAVVQDGVTAPATLEVGPTDILEAWPAKLKIEEDKDAVVAAAELEERTTELKMRDIEAELPAE
jgi:phage gp45-like